MTVYDSLGAAHTATLYFIKGAAANSWNTQLYVDGNAVGTAQPLTYSNTGALTAPTNGNVTFPAYTPATGAAAMNLTFDFSKTTQYGDNFGVTAVTQDGFTTGKLTGVSIDSTGVVQARFTNGRSINLGQIAMANFANPQGLQQLGNATWAQTNASGSVVNGVAGNSGYGTIQSGSLEDSNVDTNQPNTAAGCMSAKDDADCGPLFSNFGLPFAGKPAGTQTFFRRQAGAVSASSGGR